MDPGAPDGLAAATSSLSFSDFLERMKQPAATDLVRPLRSFMAAFLAKEPDPDADGESVQQFYRSMEAAFRAHPLWKGASEAELDSSMEALEKYLMSKLYAKAFAPVPSEVQRCGRLHARLAALKTFVRPAQLDVPAALRDDAALLLAEKELQRVNAVKSPRDKLVCCLNCCRVVNNLLLHAAITAAPNEAQAKPPGADDFLPVLIFVVLQANPPRLLSSLLFIQRFRRADRLVSETAYFFTNLLSAASFLETVSAEQLSLPPEEFSRLLAAGEEATRDAAEAAAAAAAGGGAAGAAAERDGAEAAGREAAAGGPLAGGSGSTAAPASAADPNAAPAPSQRPPSQPPPPPSAPRERALPLSSLLSSPQVAEEVLRADASGELSRAFRFLHAPAGELRVGDVEALLAEYKDLAVRYFSLCRAVHGMDLATLDSLRGRAGDKREGKEEGADGGPPAPSAVTEAAPGGAVGEGASGVAAAAEGDGPAASDGGGGADLLPQPTADPAVAGSGSEQGEREGQGAAEREAAEGQPE